MIKKNKKTAASVASFGTAFLLFTGSLFGPALAADDAENKKNTASVTFEVDLEIADRAGNEEDLAAAADILDDIPFTILLEADDTSPEPAVSYVVIKGEGSAYFETIEFTGPGEYEYTIFEQDDGIEHIIYDDTVYTIDVSVSYDNYGRLYATYSACSGEAKEDSIVFVNEIDEEFPIPEETITPSVEPTPSEAPTPSEEPTPSVIPTDEPTPSEEPIPSEAPAPSDEPTPSEKPSDDPTPTDAVPTEEAIPSEEPVSPLVTPVPTETTSSSISPVPTSNNSTTITTPKTGDSTNNIPWVVLLFVGITGSCSCVCYLYIRAKKNHGSKEDE